MVKKIHIFLLAALLAFGVAQNSQAALFDVGPNTVAAPGIPAGVPLWYQDFSGPATRTDANLNYGIGPVTLGVPTPGGLKLELCPDPAAVPGVPCISDIAGDEIFWWDAFATIPTSVGSADLILATEGGSLATPSIFNRTRIRIDLPVGGTYIVTHPFGVNVYTVTAGTRAINDSLDEGCALGTVGCDFRLALNTQIGSYLFWDSGLPITDATGGFYIGDAATPHKVLGSPKGTNFFRVDGPPGSNIGGAPVGAPTIDFIQTDLFTIQGKVFTAGGTANTAPVAVPDAAATLKATPVMIDVLANDTFTDVPINPGSVTIATVPAPVGGTAAMTVVDGRVKVKFTPTATFTGVGGFSYTVTGFGGVVSTAAAVAVTVEDLKVAKAEFRPKFFKWRITGTSSDVTANTIGIQTGPPTVSTTLSPTNEVPPLPADPTKTGRVTVTVGDAGIDFNLSISGLLNINSTHLHRGAAGTNGPILFTLAGANVTSAGGTLTAANLNLGAAAAGITFGDAVNAILSGNTYIQVHTNVADSGAVRGQLGPNRLVSSVPVQADGTWVLEGKAPALPDATHTISVRSSNGVQIIDAPLKVK